MPTEITPMEQVFLPKVLLFQKFRSETQEDLASTTLRLPPDTTTLAILPVQRLVYLPLQLQVHIQQRQAIRLRLKFRPRKLVTLQT